MVDNFLNKNLQNWLETFYQQKSSSEHMGNEMFAKLKLSL